MTSARYTFLPSTLGIGGLLDDVNEFCRKYPEYRMLTIVSSTTPGSFAAIMTTDPT